jgi:hypothetical protein
MKISPQDYQELKSLLAPLFPKLAAHREILKQDKRVKDLEMRLRWDLYSAAVASTSKGYDWQQRVYIYANDEHIDTALRRAMVELGA